MRTRQSTLPVGGGRFWRTPRIVLSGMLLALRAPDFIHEGHDPFHMDPEAGWLAGVATRRWHLAVGNEGGDPYHRDMECETRARLRKVGRQWEVAFGRGERFYLADTLGAKYLDYLLHHPNRPVSTFDLEVPITPEKGAARLRNSLQRESDPQALREYRQELGRLQGEREKAKGAGDLAEVARLAGEIAAVESMLKGGGGADTGERALDNLRKALQVVPAQLMRGGPEAQALAGHLRTHLSIGFECLHSRADC